MRLDRRTLVFLLIAPFLRSSGHSWLACVDYDEATSTCNGYARNWYNVMAGQSFSTDRGRDNRPGTDFPAGLVCDQRKEARTTPVTNAYDATYPMATLTAGQTVRWRWPAKNHATVGTQRGVQVFISPTADATTDAFIPTPIAEMDFSACNPRQANVDNADCQDTFILPANTPPGVHTMMWWWEFNAGEFYNSCADVNVVASTGPAPAPAPAPGPAPGSPTPQPVAATANFVGMICPPVAVVGTQGSSFQVDVTFTATANSVIGVDIYREGSTTSVGRGTITTDTTGARTVMRRVTVTLNEPQPIPAEISSTHILRAWLVPASSYDASVSWIMTTTEALVPVEISNAIKLHHTCAQGSGSESSSSEDSEELAKAKDANAALGTLFTLLVIGVALYVLYRCNCFAKCGLPATSSNIRTERVNSRSKASEMKMTENAVVSVDRDHSVTPPNRERSGWTKHEDDNGKAYWFNEQTGESQWENPITTI
mmetsp:Transcript_870/g.1116  ORF Transcript_870/g.1116 Transcript_870/m.1116 type:complete len:484 (-) Transcript_870:114-1565(-)|eukprot:jgi/Bigna1/89080/estExt_fgenesh1_pg.C_430068